MSHLHVSNSSTATACDEFELQRLVINEENEETETIFQEATDNGTKSRSWSRSRSRSRCHCQCPYLGLLLATCSSFFFSMCSVIVKWMAEIDPTALAAYRYIGVLLPAIPVILYKQESIIPKGKCMVLIIRCFTGTMSLMLSFYAFRHMSLADASVIIFSVPVFTAIFARMFLKEPCGIFTVFSIVLTVIGVIFIARPWFLFGSMINSLGNSRGESEVWGIVAAFSATLFGASIYVLLRALRGIHFSVLMSNFGAFALIQCLVISWWVGGLCMPPCGFDRLLIVALAVFSFGGQILLTLALQMEQAGPVSIARSTDIVFAFIWQVLFFEEVPNRYSVTGAVLVLTSVILTGMRKWALALPETSTLKPKLKIFTY